MEIILEEKFERKKNENPHAVATAINKKWLSMMTSWISNF